MQKLLKVIFFILLFKLPLAFTAYANLNQDSSFKVHTINLLDTVVFDLSQADTSSAFFDVPVFILSDDTVNALDFSFKYNQLDFIYDSIIDLTTHLQTFSYYNPFDSTLRFTSNSFQRYENDSALVLIKFNRIFGQFCMNDLSTVKVYMNGDMCSFKIIDCVQVGFESIENSKQQIFIYPNPAKQNLVIDIPENAHVQILATDGRCLMQGQLLANQKNEIALETIPNGLYFIKVYNIDFSEIKKIIIQN